MYDYKALLENWKTQWPLVITGEEGWLEGQRAEQFRRMLGNLKKQAAEEAEGEKSEKPAP